MFIRAVIHHFINEIITIELKNGYILHGTLLNSDKNMNLYLKKVKKTDILDTNLNLESILIRGNTIRYIILPVWTNFDSVLCFSNKEQKKTKNNI
jgi:small nuclear ribonucleoprotein D1